MITLIFRILSLTWFVAILSKIKSKYKRFFCLLIVGLLAPPIFLLGFPNNRFIANSDNALAAELNFYVDANSGDDNNDGQSLSTAFKTIQKCAKVASNGSRCIINSGIYRETVTPVNDGVTFLPVSEAKVTLSGANVITNFSSVEDKPYYKASDIIGFKSKINQANQVFVDGEMLPEARWPNPKADLYSTEHFSTMKKLSTNNNVVTLTDPNLTQPTDFWKGAKIAYESDNGYYFSSSTINSSAPGSLTFQLNRKPKSKGKYYIFGTKEALDFPGEWFYDDAEQSLYLRLPKDENPSEHLIEFKHRDYAFNLKGRRNITVRGLKIFAATITTDTEAGNGLPGTANRVRQNSIASSRDVILEGLDVKYPSHFTDLSGFPFAQWINNTGIILSGANHILRNSHISYSAGNGVSVLGKNNRVENNLIEYSNYQGINGGGINTGFSNTTSLDHAIAYNTVHHSGRFLIVTYSLSNSNSENPLARVHHNHLYQSCLLTRDCGAYYVTWNGEDKLDGRNVEIDHNLIHDTVDSATGAGIYLDNKANNYIVHHNLVYNAVSAMTTNEGRNLQLYNNTLLGKAYGIANCCDAGTSIKFRNNIVTKGQVHNESMIKSHNLTWDSKSGSETDPKFVDFAKGDLRLHAESPARKAGVHIPPYTDNVINGVPDIGAFQHGLDDNALMGFMPITSSSTDATLR